MVPNEPFTQLCWQGNYGSFVVLTYTGANPSIFPKVVPHVHWSNIIHETWYSHYKLRMFKYGKKPLLSRQWWHKKFWSLLLAHANAFIHQDVHILLLGWAQTFIFLCSRLPCMFDHLQHFCFWTSPVQICNWLAVVLHPFGVLEGLGLLHGLPSMRLWRISFNIIDPLIKTLLKVFLFQFYTSGGLLDYQLFEPILSSSLVVRRRVILYFIRDVGQLNLWMCNLQALLYSPVAPPIHFVRETELSFLPVSSF